MKVVLYTKPGCPMCKMLKSVLDKNNIKYELVNDIDIMIAKGFTHAPMLEVDGKYMNLSEARRWAEEQK